MFIKAFVVHFALSVSFRGTLNAPKQYWAVNRYFPACTEDSFFSEADAF